MLFTPSARDRKEEGGEEKVTVHDGREREERERWRSPSNRRRIDATVQKTTKIQDGAPLNPSIEGDSF